MSLIISNKRAVLIIIHSCGAFRLLKRAESSTTNRTFSGVTQIVKCPCPNNPCVSRLTGTKGPGTVRFPLTLEGRRDFSFSFDKLGSTIVGCVRTGRVGGIPISCRSMTTSFRGTIMGTLLRGAVTTLSGAGLGAMTLTNNITTGDKLHRTVRGGYLGEGIHVYDPTLKLYASGNTVVNYQTCCVTRGKSFTPVALGTSPHLPFLTRQKGIWEWFGANNACRSTLFTNP